MKEPMKKPCAAWTEKLAARHPGDLSTDECAGLNAHIAVCPACAAVSAEYLLIDALILAYPSGGTLPVLLAPRLVLPESRVSDLDCRQT